jgi:hypothetical protein
MLLGTPPGLQNIFAAQYSQMLLEHLVGEDVPIVKARHAVWVSTQLDAIEQQKARALLLNGVQGPQKAGLQ